jgi:hypothetical protein
MQLEIFNQQAAELAQAANIKIVMDRCPKIELEKPYWTGKESSGLPRAQKPGRRDHNVKSVEQ